MVPATQMQKANCLRGGANDGTIRYDVQQTGGGGVKMFSMTRNRATITVSDGWVSFPLRNFTRKEQTSAATSGSRRKQTHTNRALSQILLQAMKDQLAHRPITAKLQYSGHAQKRLKTHTHALKLVCSNLKVHVPRRCPQTFYAVLAAPPANPCTRRGCLSYGACVTIAAKQDGCKGRGYAISSVGRVARGLTTQLRSQPLDQKGYGRWAPQRGHLHMYPVDTFRDALSRPGSGSFIILSGRTAIFYSRVVQDTAVATCGRRGRV